MIRRQGLKVLFLFYVSDEMEVKNPPSTVKMSKAKEFICFIKIIPLFGANKGIILIRLNGQKWLLKIAFLL
ncbi:MAG: hypothetical protein U9R14_02580 [Patescibacteria group bacterium]|nr:hypothetical protein [Patescibacteria group bacterium]